MYVCPRNIKKVICIQLIDSSGIWLPDFPLRTEIIFSDMHIIPSMFSAIISKLDPHEVAGLDVNPAIV